MVVIQYSADMKFAKLTPFNKGLAVILLAFIFLGGAIALIYILKWIFRSAFIQSLLMHERVHYFSEKIKNGIDKFLSSGNDVGDK